MFFSEYLGYALLVVGIFTAYMALVNLLRKDRNKTRAEKIILSTHDLEKQYDSLDVKATVIKTILILTGVNFDKQDEVSMQLAKAGYNSQRSLIYYLFFQRIIQPALLIIGMGILIKLLIYNRTEISDHLALFITGLLLSVIGGYGGKLFLSNSATKRSQELSKTFPEALDLILICVESGLGVDAAFARVCNEMRHTHPVVASEFDRTRFEMTMMSDRIQALQNFSDRTGLNAVRSLVSSLIQAERFGTSLVDTMRTISEEQRTDRMMRAEERAARLPAMITLPLIIFILPGLFMIILGPAVIKIVEQGGIFGR
ncbi:MAG: type II secretion system F family protein [Rickettsiales bacterium]